MSHDRTNAASSSGGGSGSGSGSGCENMSKLYVGETNDRTDCASSGNCGVRFSSSSSSRKCVGNNGRSSPGISGGRSCDGSGGRSRSDRAHTRTFLGALSANSGELEGRYWVGEVLGTGRFGVVRKVMEKTTGRIYACKTMDRRRVMAETAAVENLEMELFALSALPAHPNLLRLASVHVQPPNPQVDHAPLRPSASAGRDREQDKGDGLIHIVMELCEGGDLYETIEAFVMAAGLAPNAAEVYPTLASAAPNDSNCTLHLVESAGGSGGDDGSMEGVTTDGLAVAGFYCLPQLCERGAYGGDEAACLESPDSCTSASSFSSSNSGSSFRSRGSSASSNGSSRVRTTTATTTTATNCGSHASCNAGNVSSLSLRTSRLGTDGSSKLPEQVDVELPEQVDAEMPEAGYSEALEMYRQQPAMPEWLCAWVIHQTALALSHCHRLGLVHRDVKPENIFLSQAVRPGSPTTPGSHELQGCFLDQPLAGLPEVRLGDFGQAVLVLPGEHVSGRAGSIPYMAPEVYAREWYDSSADIWSLGVTLYAMLSGSLPFSEPPVLELPVASATLADTPSSSAHGTFHSGPSGASLSILPDLVSDPWPSISISARHLISWMLRANPQHRPTARQVLAHPWFKEAIEGL